jgi:predicted nucleotidyltransferase
METTAQERQTKASEIIGVLEEHLPAILQGRPVMAAYAYGSIAAGCPLPNSDVDIALVWMSDCTLDAYQRFQTELEIATEIESRCGIPDADVRSINDAPLRVRGQVLTEGVLLYSRDEDLRIAYEVYTRKRYFDFQPTLEMMRQAYFTHMEADLREKGLW